jgi:hypothetical protein
MKAMSLIVALLLISGCSVGMALSGKEDPNLNIVRSGASRGEIELQLGDPVSISTESNGCTRCLYEFSQGNNPSAGRAIAHGAMDVLTLGIWEVVGTPIEGFKGTKRRVEIVYGPDNKVKDVLAANSISSPATARSSTPDSQTAGSKSSEAK